jgi:hypothetical protein
MPWPRQAAAAHAVRVNSSSHRVTTVLILCMHELHGFANQAWGCFIKDAVNGWTSLPQSCSSLVLAMYMAPSLAAHMPGRPCAAAPHAFARTYHHHQCSTAALLL